MCLHEAAHVVVSKYFGVETEKVIITPIGLVGKLKAFDFLSTYKKAAIVLAGPLTNLLIAIASTIFAPENSFIASANLIIFFFNMLPIYPLDGGRLFIIFSNNVIGAMNATNVLRKISNGFGVLIIILGFVQVVLFPYNVSLLCMGLYVLFINRTFGIDGQMAFIKVMTFGKGKLSQGVLPLKYHVALDDVQLAKIINMLSYNTYFVLHIFENGNELATITEQQLINYILTVGLSGTIKDVINSI